jgi:hypothetical protein
MLQPASSLATDTEQKELLQACLRKCEHDILTEADVEEINLLMSKRASSFTTDESQAPEFMKIFLKGHGYVKTGGFDFQFKETKSFDIKGWSIHISNTALLITALLIFGLCVLPAVFPGAATATLTVTATSATASCCLM